jgi:16S rRNA (cytidine1402-2'-O)-methyltransferase
MAATLYLVGTPIGNRGDLAPRAVETLESVDLIAAEDTRRTGRLLKAFDIRTPLVSFFEGNERERTDELVARLRDGADVGLVTDGGMPSVSDPGYRLVRACADAEIDVRVVPGPSSAIAALVVSGLPTDRFAFEGFLPRAREARRSRLASLKEDPRTLVLFESPRRVRALLADALEVLGDRPAALARELTKLHEEVVRGSISDLVDHLGDRDPKGEVVLVLGGAHSPVPDMELCVAEARALVAGGMPKRDAARTVADRAGVSTNDVYQALLERGRETT